MVKTAMLAVVSVVGGAVVVTNPAQTMPAPLSQRKPATMRKMMDRVAVVAVVDAVAVAGPVKTVGLWMPSPGFVPGCPMARTLLSGTIPPRT